MDKEKKIAVLIDADNVSDKYIKFIINEISNFGTPTYKRIYGDFTSTRLSSWKNVLLDYSITPVQQYSYTVGKNATDAALIIDAMDILYSGNVDGFCIVSSDSDFTKLAARLREAGMYVIGMGEKKTPKPFIYACEKFIYLEVLAANTKDNKNLHADVSENESIPKQDAPKNNIANKNEIIEAIKTIIEDNSDDDGWVFLGEVGNMLNKRYPDFDTRNYGYSKLTPFIRSLKAFEIQPRKTGTKNAILNYVRNIA